VGAFTCISDCACLTGITIVLNSGLPWELLPDELACGSGITSWHRLRDWQTAGVWDRLHRALLDELGEPGQLARGQASLGSASVPANTGARQRGGPDEPRPTGRTAPLQ
jgi:transposase